MLFTECSFPTPPPPPKTVTEEDVSFSCKSHAAAEGSSFHPGQNKGCLSASMVYNHRTDRKYTCEIHDLFCRDITCFP